MAEHISSAYRPSLSTQSIDLNTPLRAGVHNEEVGDFSENEEDLLTRYAAETDVANDVFLEQFWPSFVIPNEGPSTTLPSYEPPSHFSNVTSHEGNYSNEFDHPLSQDDTYHTTDPDNLQVGMKFPTKEMAKHAVKEYHLKKSLDFRVEYSEATRWIGRCLDNDCKWKCRVSFRKKLQVWEIRKLDEQHTCASTRLSQDHRHINLQLGDYENEKLEEVKNMTRKKYIALH